MSDTRPYYHEFAWAYDLLQPAPIAHRVDFIGSILSSQGVRENATILDAGCGTGRYAVELAERGYRVLGVDRSPELVTIAQNRAVRIGSRSIFLIADLLNLSFSRKFDAVLCRGVLNDLVKESDRSTIFQQFGEWTRPGGVLVFDVREWTRTAARYRKDPTYRRVVELPDGRLEFRSDTILNRKSHRLDIREYFDVSRNGARTSTTNRFAMRCWTSTEAKAYLSAVGLKTISEHPSYGDNDTMWTDRLVIVARRET